MKELFIEIQKEWRTIFALSMAVFLVLQGVSAPVWGWTGPSASPPGGDIPAPIFGSYSSQTRLGALTIAGLVSVGSNLVVGGMGYFGGNTIINGILTMNSRANVCKTVDYIIKPDYTGCGANYYIIGALCVVNVPNVGSVETLVNPSTLTGGASPVCPSGRIICCKNND